MTTSERITATMVAVGLVGGAVGILAAVAPAFTGGLVLGCLAAWLIVPRRMR